MAAAGAPRVVLLRAAGAPVPAWAAAAAVEDVPVADGAAAAAALPDGTECVLVDDASLDALPVARRVHQADADVQVVVVVVADRRRALERTMLFTPGLGELWLASPAEVTATLAERAAGVTRARRRFRRTRERVARDHVERSPQRTERALISDAYLADLLQVAPDPIFSVDAAGRVLSANPAAERVLGVPAPEIVGCMLAQALGVADLVPGAGVGALFAAGATYPASRELSFRRAGDTLGFGELFVARVAAGHTPLFAVVLHDLTDRQHAQQQLEEQATELELQASMLQEQTVELEQANHELLQQRAQLEEALAARSRFYAAMSHELRTPINAVIGYSALILEGIYGPLTDRQREGLGRSQRAAQHLLELVNDVLDLAKIEAGRMELVLEDVDPVALAEDILHSVQPTAEEAGSELRFECTAPSPARVRTDPRRVRQILLNLLSNAIKFGEGRPVVLRCAPADPAGYALSVEDHGVGIPASEQQRIFEEFVQLDADGPGGTGLGLTISRRLAQLLGGALTVRSAPGEGSTFTLTLPARA